MVVLSPLDYGYLTTTSEQRAEARMKTARVADAKVKAMAELFDASCTLKDDVTGLYTQEFHSFVAKTYQTRHEPVDIRGWDFKSGVAYWGLKGRIPEGFLVEHRKQVDEAVLKAVKQVGKAPPAPQ